MRAVATALQPPAGPVFLSFPLGDWEMSCEGPAVVRTVSQRNCAGPVAPGRICKDPLRGTLTGAELWRCNCARQRLRSGGGMCRGAWRTGLGGTPLPNDHLFLRIILSIPVAYHLPCDRSARSWKGTTLHWWLAHQFFRFYPYVPGPYLPAGLRLLHISDDPAETARAPVGDSLLGDAVLSLEGLKHLLGDCKLKATRARELVRRWDYWLMYQWCLATPSCANWARASQGPSLRGWDRQSCLKRWRLQPSPISFPICPFCCCPGIQGNSCTVCLSSLVVRCCQRCWSP